MSWKTKLSPALKELRFLFCQSSASSEATRSFIKHNYTDLKSSNPLLPVLLRECTGIQPQIWARFEFGEEKGIRLSDLSEKQIDAKLKELLKHG